MQGLTAHEETRLPDLNEVAGGKRVALETSSTYLKGT